MCSRPQAKKSGLGLVGQLGALVVTDVLSDLGVVEDVWEIVAAVANRKRIWR